MTLQAIDTVVTHQALIMGSVRDALTNLPLLRAPTVTQEQHITVCNIRGRGNGDGRVLGGGIVGQQGPDLVGRRDAKEIDFGKRRIVTHHPCDKDPLPAIGKKALDCVRQEVTVVCKDAMV
jgi:hypothetical protein